jgi:hypothetical protein
MAGAISTQMVCMFNPCTYTVSVLELHIVPITARRKLNLKPVHYVQHLHSGCAYSYQPEAVQLDIQQQAER